MVLCTCLSRRRAIAECITVLEKKEGEYAEFFNSDLKNLIVELKQEKRKNIHYDGGGEVVYALLKDVLIDKMIISIIPHLVDK